MILVSFVFFLIVFFVIGMSSSFASRRTAGDYYLASRDVAPIFVGLSAMSTNNSGYMFIGLMGFTYNVGLSVFWLIFGWVVGDFLTSLYVHRKLRSMSEAAGALTFASVIARWGDQNFVKNFQIVRLMIALVSLIFLSIYAAAQLNAGGKALEALFGFPSIAGALVVAVMVALYCMAGGIRASLWTDAAQSIVMFVSMAILAMVAVSAAGGIDASFNQLSAIPNYLNWFPYQDLPFAGMPVWFLGPILFVLGWLIAGFCASGQPHIMIRFMTMKSVDQLVTVRLWYYGFYALFGMLAIIVGLMTKIHVADIATLDPEMVLPTMAAGLLPDIMVGLMLAGVFAATMSTADSLILSCSSALTHDLLPDRFESQAEMKMITLGVTLFAFSVAWYAQAFGGQNVFSLTQFAWAGMGASFGPVLLLLALGKRLIQTQMLMIMGVGLLTVVTFRLSDWGLVMFGDGFAGVIAAFLVWFLSRRLFLAPPVLVEEGGHALR